jgi:hypothetical protein
VIIDEHAARHVRAFDEHPGFDPSYERSVIDGDLLDPEVWQRVGQTATAQGLDPVVILGSGSDGTNLHAAFLARSRHPGAYVIVRSFRASPFTAEVAEEAHLNAFDLAGLIREGMPPRWF